MEDMSAGKDLDQFLRGVIVVTKILLIIGMEFEVLLGGKVFCC